MSFVLLDSSGDGDDLCTLKGLGELRKASKGLSRTAAFFVSGTIADEGERDAILRETAKKPEFDDLRDLLRNGKAPFTLTDGVVDDDKGDDMSTTTTTDKPKPSLRDVLLRRKRAAKNASQLAMFTPGPCISGYDAGHKQRVAKNTGTSEGVRKSWQKRKHSGVAPSSSLDASVASLKPGATHHIGSFGDVKTWIERSGDGKKLRHVRQSGQSTSVIREWRHPSAINSDTPLTGPGSWLHTQGQKTGAQADAEERSAVLRGRLIRHLNKAKRPKPLPKVAENTGTSEGAKEGWVQRLLHGGGKPKTDFNEHGISPAERRHRAWLYATRSKQEPKPVNYIPDKRIQRNEWVKGVYGNLTKAPQTWLKGRVE